MAAIFSTCWYIFKCKFNESTYAGWIHNMLSNVNNYYLVIYTDENSISYVKPYADANPRILIIIKPMEEFYCYKYKNNWIKNHENSYWLKKYVDWRVNMLWSEKIHFVCQTIENGYFANELCESNPNTAWYGWCDIGYFRGRYNDMTSQELYNWPSKDKLNEFSRNKIYYGRVNNDAEYMKQLFLNINDKNENGLPAIPLPERVISVAGGFFILDKSKSEWWRNMYDNKLGLYFENDYLVNDDQMVIVDCIFSNMQHFSLCIEKNTHFDIWFLFQRILL